MSDKISPAELAAYAAMKRAFTSIRLNLGKHLQQVAGISLVQFEILFLLEQSPEGLRMHEIAEATGQSRSGMTYQITQMEELGWVQRTAGLANSRAVIATLTPEGTAKVKDLQDEHFAFVRKKAFGFLSEDEIVLLTSIISKVADGPADQR